MVLQSSSNTSPLCSGLSQRKNLSISFCPCAAATTANNNNIFHPLSRKRAITTIKNVRLALVRARASTNGGGNRNPFDNTAKTIVLKRFADDEEYDYASLNTTNNENNFYSPNFGPDPIVDKLRNQLGVIHPIPIPTPPPINRSIFGLFAFFFFVGVVFDKLWMSRKRNETSSESKGGERGSWAQVPSSLSLFLEKDFVQRKESVEWVNMVLGKLWKVYRGGIENWLIGLLQPVIDNLQKPDYVERVEIKQFSLGDEPLSVRSVERRTSRRVNDLQYQIGLRYTGGARMLLLLSLKFGLLPIVVPVGVRDFDIDGELWVKLRLVPTEPWVGAVSWAFVSLPKIKFELSPFRLFNLMAIPVLSIGRMWEVAPSKILRAGYFWPSLKKDAEDLVRTCKKCQYHSPLMHRPAEELMTMSAPCPFSKWGIDLVGPFPMASGQRKFLVVAVDYFSKWVEAEALAKINEEAIIKFLWKNIVCRYGVPRILISDNGSQFAGKGIKDWCELMKIEQRFVSVYHPQANGQVEATNKILVRGLKTRLEKSGGRWVDELHSVLWAYRTNPKEATGDTPFGLVYGMEAVVPAEVATITHRVQVFNEIQNEMLAKEALDMISERREDAFLRMEKARSRMRAVYNSNVMKRNFQVGDLVLQNANLAKNMGKLGATWEGPYRVIAVLAGGGYQLETLWGETVPRIWNVMNLKKFFV